MDGGLLVGRFFKTKGVGKSFVIACAKAKGVAFTRGTAGVNVEQLGGAVADLFCGFAFGFFPLATAQAVQRRFIRADPGVAADQLQLADRHIQRGLVGVFEVQKLLDLRIAIGLHLAQIQVHQTPVTPDTVGAVHHRVAHVQLAQVFDEGFNVADLLLLFLAPRGRPGGEEFGFGDQVNATQLPLFAIRQPAEPGLQQRGGNAQSFAAGLEVFQRIKSGWADLRSAQKIQQAFAPAITLGQDQQALLGVAGIGFERGQRVVCTAYHGEVGQVIELDVS